MSNTFGRYLEDFKTDQLIEHQLSKTITESDNNLFCLLTMNHHPVHLNIEYARHEVHKDILVVGTYVLSLVVGLTVSDISGKAVANLGYESIIHNQPVFLNDTISAETKVLSIRDSKSNPNNGIVCVETRAFNQHGEVVLTLRRHILVPRRPA